MRPKVQIDAIVGDVYSFRNLDLLRQSQNKTEIRFGLSRPVRLPEGVYQFAVSIRKDEIPQLTKFPSARKKDRQAL